jgi:hypothetical protein
MRHLTEANRKRAADLAAKQPAPVVTLAAQGGAGGSGSGGGRPINWTSPNGNLALAADATDAMAIVKLSHSCGSQIRLYIDASGNAAMRVVNCSGDGYRLDSDGLAAVHVDTNAETGEETEAESAGGALGTVTIMGCVDGVDKSITVMGRVAS